MKFISIQGKAAPAFQFEGREKFASQSLMKTLAGNDYLVITSRFRTDILYEHAEDKNLSIIRLWCLYKQKEFNPSLLAKFYRTHTTIDSLVECFIRLTHLQRIPKWSDSYLHSFNEQLSNQDNQISQYLRECSEILLNKEVLAAAGTIKTQKTETDLYSDIHSIVIDMMDKYGSN